MRSLRILLVSAYLVAVGLWLLLTRQVQAPGLKKIVKRSFARTYWGELTDIRPEQEHCWLASVPEDLLSDKEASSSLILLEDGRALGPSHTPHAEIRVIGKGRYSHWGALVYFSTSDNTDPRTNARQYSVTEKPDR
jgi:hypothetical protein